MVLPSRKSLRKPRCHLPASIRLLWLGSVLIFLWMTRRHPWISSLFQTPNKPSSRTIQFPPYPNNQLHSAQYSPTTRLRGRPYNATTLKHRILVYRPPFEAAQGVGNLMNGLYAAHLLAKEFGWTLCVSPEWQDFFLAWQVLDPICSGAQRILPKRTSSNTLWVLNFAKLPINECELKKRLTELNTNTSPSAVLYLVMNTYPPPWPSLGQLAWTPTLEEFCRPTPALLEFLPWNTTSCDDNESPALVVHLRQADAESRDHRAGMDMDTFQALGRMLPANASTFLVTNQVDLYEHFEQNFGWGHPPWIQVRHSALSSVQWGKSSPAAVPPPRRQQILELWADWYTVYNAKVVYHTLSDFSASALRWSRQVNYQIHGVQKESGLPVLEQISWGGGGEEKPETLVQPFSMRSVLQNCQLYPSGLSGLNYVLDLDDALHDDLVDV